MPIKTKLHLSEWWPEENKVQGKNFLKDYLPEDVHSHVIGYLNRGDLGRLSRTCHHYRDCANTEAAHEAKMAALAAVALNVATYTNLHYSEDDYSGRRFQNQADDYPVLCARAITNHKRHAPHGFFVHICNQESGHTYYQALVAHNPLLVRGKCPNMVTLDLQGAQIMDPDALAADLWNSRVMMTVLAVTRHGPRLVHCNLIDCYSARETSTLAPVKQIPGPQPQWRLETNRQDVLSSRKPQWWYYQYTTTALFLDVTKDSKEGHTDRDPFVSDYWFDDTLASLPANPVTSISLQQVTVKFGIHDDRCWADDGWWADEGEYEEADSDSECESVRWVRYRCRNPAQRSYHDAEDDFDYPPVESQPCTGRQGRRAKHAGKHHKHRRRFRK